MDFGKMANKAKDALGQHGDKVSDGIDKAADMAKSKFGDKADKIDDVADKAKGFLGGDSNRGDADRGESNK